MKYFLFFVLTVLFCSSSFAGIYKWKDESGRWCYSDREPNDKQAEEMNISVRQSTGYAGHVSDVADVYVQPKPTSSRLKITERGHVHNAELTGFDITGTVKNRAGYTANNCRVVIRFYDKRRKFFHLEDVELRPNSIGPRQTGTFELSVPYSVVGRVISWDAELKADY